MNIVLFGPPGAGKGTQANNIVKKFNLYKISTGDLLRNEIKKKTSLGIKFKSVIDEGKLVSDDIINDLIKNILLEKKFYNKIIFDGYPRNLNQAKSLSILLNIHNQKISCVLNLKVDKEIVLKRILGRQSCSKCGLIFNEYFNSSKNPNHLCDPKYLVKRSDDNEKTIISRYETYLEKTLPILDFYKKQNLLHEINGKEDIDQIFVKIRAIMTPLQA